MSFPSFALCVLTEPRDLRSLCELALVAVEVALPLAIGRVTVVCIGTIVD